MLSDNHNKNFPNSRLVEEIDPGVFKIRVNLETREAGVEDIKVSQEVVTVWCTDYIVQVPNDRDFNSVVEAIEYKLLDKEENTRIIRQVLTYIDNIHILMESIFDYFNQDLAKNND
jgi:hypothetical protein